MSWTYNPSLPTDRDYVRFLIRDNDLTDANNHLMPDETIDALLVRFVNVYLTASVAAGSLASNPNLQNQSISLDGLSVDKGQSFTYKDLANWLMIQYQTGQGRLSAPFVSGVSKGEMDAVDANDDRSPSKFKLGMDEDSEGTPSLVRSTIS